MRRICVLALAALFIGGFALIQAMLTVVRSQISRAMATFLGGNATAFRHRDMPPRFRLRIGPLTARAT